MLLSLNGRMYKEDIIEANLIKSLQKQEKNFQKVIGGLFEYFGIIPKEKIKKIYFEIIFN